MYTVIGIIMIYSGIRQIKDNVFEDWLPYIAGFFVLLFGLASVIYGLLIAIPNIR